MICIDVQTPVADLPTTVSAISITGEKIVLVANLRTTAEITRFEVDTSQLITGAYLLAIDMQTRSYVTPIRIYN